MGFGLVHRFMCCRLFSLCFVVIFPSGVCIDLRVHVLWVVVNIEHVRAVPFVALVVIWRCGMNDMICICSYAPHNIVIFV